MKDSNSKRNLKKCCLFFAAPLLAITFAVFAGQSSVADISAIKGKQVMGKDGGIYYSAFSSNDELKEATKEKNKEIVADSVILLKNGGGSTGKENMLPYSGMKNISLFGVNSWAYAYGGTGSGSGQLEEGADIYTSLKNAGLNINPKLKELYMNNSAGSLSTSSRYLTPTYEDTELPLSKYTQAIQATYSRYHDAAFIFLSRLGGEGVDLDTKDVEGRDDPSMHYLELTAKEKALIKHVESNFDKVVVLVNSGNILEMGELQDDPNISAILSIGQTGDYGFDGVIKVLKGEVSPSGRTVDIWTRDFKNDPTFQNFGDGAQTVESGTNDTYKFKADANADKTSDVGKEVEYEEGIYVGYRYYETMYDEIKEGHVSLTDEKAKSVLGSEDIGNTFADADDWYGKSVVYPFGYGLSYTTFEWANMTVESTGSGKDMKFKVKVDVKNNGSVAGKDVVEIYMNAPYTKGGIEKSYVKLVGFAKTGTLVPNETETVEVDFDAYQVASYDYSDANSNNFKGYEIEAGQYNFFASRNSHDVVLDKSVNLSAAKIETSKETDQKIENVFTKNGEGSNYNYSSISPTMTIMSRSDMISTYPVAPTEAERTIITENDSTTNPLSKDKEYEITKGEIYKKYNFGFLFGYDDESKERWNKWGENASTDDIIPSSWTQASDETATVNIRLADMMGIDPYDTTSTVVSSNTFINGKTHAEAWDLFLNQFTYDELKKLNTTGFFKTAEVSRLGKTEAVDADGPCTIGGQTKNGYISQRGPSGTRYWSSSQVLASSWNLDLASDFGNLIGEEGLWNGYNGWYAPGMNIHRSPFSGRNFEYYSQDGVHAGLVTSKVIEGAAKHGVYAYIKHFALNDQETSRSNGISTWADEQTIREIYLTPFQYAVEEGGSAALMTAFNRIGTVGCSENYPLLTSILRDEWGFKGTVVTDYGVGTVGDNMNNLEIMTRVGNNIPLKDVGENARGCGEWDATLRNGKGGVKVGKVTATESTDYFGNKTVTKTYSTTDFWKDTLSTNMQYYYTRTRALELLYTAARSNLMDNGADFAKNFCDQEIVFYKGLDGTKSLVTGYGEQDDVSYEIVENNLPDGVSFDESDGVFEAKSYASGATGTIKLIAKYDGWASSTPITVTVRFEEPIEFNGEVNLEKNKAYSATISQSQWTADENLGANEPGIISVTSKVEGLPAGLSYDATKGTITGTPTTAGKYTIKISYDVKERKVMHWGAYSWSTVSTNTYTREVVLTIGDLVTVSFNGEEQSIEKGSVITAPSAPEAEEGMEFVGWGVDGEVYDFSNPINEDMQFSAIFKKMDDVIEYRVHEGMIQTRTNGGEWVDVIAVSELKGEKGDKGDTGATGAAGEKGDKGDTGAAGKDGANGTDGKAGCGGSIIAASSALGALSLIGLGLVLKKKKEDK